MSEIKNLPKTKKDFERLGAACMAAYCEQAAPIDEKERDWTQADIDLFIQQFNGSQQEEEADIDMNKLDPKFISYSEIAEKFEGFNDDVLQVLYECENKKLEDARLTPFRVEYKKTNLNDDLSLDTTIDEAETEAEPINDPDCEDCIPIGREKEEKKEEEEEEEDDLGGEWRNIVV